MKNGVWNIIHGKKVIKFDMYFKNNKTFLEQYNRKIVIYHSIKLIDPIEKIIYWFLTK